MQLVERMQVKAIGIVNAYVDRLMRALEPVLRQRFVADAEDPPVPTHVFETGEMAPSEIFLRHVFHAVDAQAAGDLQRVVSVPLARVLPNARKLEQTWVRNNVDLIRIGERARREVEAIITDPLKQGSRVEEIRALIQERLGVVRSRAELIARDQTLKLYGEIQQARQEAAGIKRYVWSTSDDERVRPDHEDLDGTTQSWDSPPVVDKRTGRRAHPGGDFQCLPGDAKVALAGPVERAFCRSYAGQLTAIVTDSGETLECTPNHPVLTSTGWKAAKAVQVGDDVFNARERGLYFFEAHVENAQPGIADIFQTLALFFEPRRHSAVATQFHGDATVDEQIYVVDVNGGLRADDEIALLQHLADFDFTFPDATAFALRQADLVLDCLGLSAYRSVRILRDCLADFARRASETLTVCPGGAAWLHTLSDQEVSDCLALNAVAFRQCFDGHTLGLKLHALVVREWLRIVRGAVTATKRDASTRASDAEALAIAAQAPADFSPAQGFIAQRASVVDVCFRDYVGHVYNLQTTCNWFVAQQLITHNCRCAAIPVLDD